MFTWWRSFLFFSFSFFTTDWRIIHFEKLYLVASKSHSQTIRFAVTQVGPAFDTICSFVCHRNALYSVGKHHISNICILWKDCLVIYFQSVLAIIVLHVYFSFVDVGDSLSEKIGLGKWAPGRQNDQIKRELLDDLVGYQDIHTFLRR